MRERLQVWNIFFLKETEKNRVLQMYGSFQVSLPLSPLTKPPTSTPWSDPAVWDIPTTALGDVLEEATYVQFSIQLLNLCSLLLLFPTFLSTYISRDYMKAQMMQTIFFFIFFLIFYPTTKNANRGLSQTGTRVVFISRAVGA